MKSKIPQMKKPFKDRYFVFYLLSIFEVWTAFNFRFLFHSFLIQSFAVQRVIFDVVLIVGAFLYWVYNNDIATPFADIEHADAIFYFASLYIILRIVVAFILKTFSDSHNIEKNAENSIKSRNYSNAISYLAFKIWKECQTWERKVFKFKLELQRCIDALKAETEIAHNEEKLKRIIRSIKRRNTNFYERLLFLHHMMLALGEKMDIPAHRVSDELFHFSPGIFYSELQDTIGKMEEVVQYQADNLEELEQINKTLKNRLRNLRTIKFDQKSLFKYKGLHDGIYRMTRGFGISSSLSIYIKEFEQIFKEFSNKDEVLSNSKKFKNKIYFWYSRRRISGSFDLHALFLKYAITSKISSLVHFLESPIFDPGEKDRNEINDLPKPFGATYPSFKELIKTERKAIRDSLKEKIWKHLEENKEKIEQVIFVTQGFSSVVNDSLDGLVDEFSKIKETFGMKGRTVYFLLFSPEKMESEHLTTTRYLKYRFKINKNVLAKSQRKINVKLGKSDWLLKSYDKETTQVFLLSGAEVIFKSPDSKKIRFVNTEGIDKDESLGIKKARLSHFILAESYKIFEKPIEQFSQVSRDIFQDSMSQEYTEHCHFYGWSENKTIVTGLNQKVDHALSEPETSVTPLSKFRNWTKRKFFGK